MSQTYKKEYSATNVVLQNVEKDTFNTIGVYEKTTLLELKSFNGFNHLRNIQTCTGSGSVTIESNEYKLSTQTSNDTVLLKSKQKGSYVVGKSCSVGMAIRFSAAPVGDQTVSWGYFDENDGFYFKKTSDNFYVCIKREGVEVSIPRSQFNIDKIDGSGGSSSLIGWGAGNIFRIKYSWYGYGAIEFHVVGKDTFGVSKNLPIHTYQTEGHTSVSTPCLPISVKIENGTTNAPLSIFVAGRSLDVLGHFSPQYRSNGCNVVGKTISSTLTPLLSIKKQAAYANIICYLADLSIKTTDDTYIEIRIDTTLTNSSYISLANRETCVDYDVSADTVTGGMIIWCGMVPANTGSVFKIGPSVSIEECTVSAYSLGNSSTVNYAHLNWQCDW